MEWVDSLLKSSQRYNHEHDDRGCDSGTMDKYTSRKHSRSKSEGNYGVKYSSTQPTSHQGIYKESFTITPSQETDQQDHDVKQLTMVYSLSTPQLSLEQLFMNIDPDWHSTVKVASSEICNDDSGTSSNHSTNKKRQSQSPDASEQARSKMKRSDNLEESEADNSISTPKTPDRLAVDSPNSDGQMNSNTPTNEMNNDKDNVTPNEDPFKDKLLAAMALLKKRKISKTPQQDSDKSKNESHFKMYTYDVQKDSDGLYISSVYCDSVVIGRATGKNPVLTQRQAFKVALVNVCKCCPKESVYLEKSLFTPPICPREKHWSKNIREKKILDMFLLFDICMKERGLPYTSDTQEDFDGSYKCSVYSDFVCICCANKSDRTAALRMACGGAIQLITKKFPQEGTPKKFTEKVVAQIRPSPNSFKNQTSNDGMARIPSLMDMTPSPIRLIKNANQKHSPFRIDFMSNQLRSPSMDGDGNQGNFNTYSPFIDKFILFEEGISQQLDAFSVLHKSARFSFVQLMPRFEKQNPHTEAISCTLMVDGEFLAEASGSTKEEAQNNVSSLALKKLKTFRPTIRVKESNYISGTIVTHMELFGEETEFEKKEVPCREDYEEPKNQHFHIFNHHNFRDFRNDIVYAVFTPVVEKFVTNLWLDELAFDFEFSNSERFVIHQICRRFDLNSVSQGRDNNRFLVMSRRRNAQELLADLIKLGGSTSKYELIKPQA